MSKHNTLENSILLLLFNGTTIANLADDAGTSPATSLTVALHTGDPGEGGDMTTNEANYTGYSRETVLRTGAGWTVTNDSVSPAADIDFGECTAGTNTITHFSVGTGVSDNIMYSGALTSSISVSAGVIPRIKSTTTITEA